MNQQRYIEKLLPSKPSSLELWQMHLAALARASSAIENDAAFASQSSGMRRNSHQIIQSGEKNEPSHRKLSNSTNRTTTKQ